MRVIGITGQVGSGKSEVLSHLGGLFHCRIIRADDVARKLQEPGGECYAAVRAILGDECLLKDGSFDRAKVAGRIFADPELLSRINGIVHPAVKDHITREIKRAAQEGFDVVFLEAALLLEGGYRDICDEIWYIYVDDKERFRRLRTSRGYSDEKIRSILSKQLSDAQFRRQCDLVIDNSGSIDDTLGQVKIWQQKNMQDNLCSALT